MIKGILEFYKASITNYLKTVGKTLREDEIKNIALSLNGSDSCSCSDGVLIVRKTALAREVDKVLACHQINDDDKRRVAVLFNNISSDIEVLTSHFMIENELISRTNLFESAEEKMAKLKELTGITDV